MITKGRCGTGKHATPDYAPQYGVYIYNEKNDFCTVKSKNAKDDADFIAEAFNTYNETGLIPSQLAEQQKDLLEACKIGLEYINQANKCSKPDCRACMRLKQDKKAILEAIAKAEAAV